MKVLLPFVCVVLFAAFTTADSVEDSADGTEISLEKRQTCPTLILPCRYYLPNYCEFIRRAIQGGKPTRLHRITDGKAITKNKRLSRCGGADGGNDACARYPFATTSEGGSGASKTRVPKGENALQRSIVLNFFRTSSIGNGGCFNVELEFILEREVNK
ncbi:Hypothetical predicted protein [Paramuricea clavata]|uniref:Deoxyribonuclease NucA/NucB domain-containing protein n=1 Tax=Paramuricea clavata TaxID=317549 RepID=A0A7D9I8D0_PARCT|nr:Hypothetical predicted protein [Paramuricea clavata]